MTSFLSLAGTTGICGRALGESCGSLVYARLPDSQILDEVESRGARRVSQSIGFLKKAACTSVEIQGR